ncbi:MAG: DUF433 domain-containing protein [bacterium]
MNKNNIYGVEGVCGGAPILRGRRITVANVVSLGLVSQSLPEAEAEVADLGLEPEDLMDAREYCSHLACVFDSTIDSFCEACLFDAVKDHNPVDFRELLESFSKSLDVDLLRGKIPHDILDDEDNRYWFLASQPIGYWEWLDVYDESGNWVDVKRSSTNPKPRGCGV